MFPTEQPRSDATNDKPALEYEKLRNCIEHAAHLLPSQRPITSFVHHNTLHAFEEERFDEAMRIASTTYRCQTYLPEDQYHRCLEQGEIDPQDLSTVLQKDLGATGEHPVGIFGTRFHLRQAMLQYRIGQSAPAELRWLIAESDALRCFRSDLPVATREQLVQQTRRWVMRDFYNENIAIDEDSINEPRLLKRRQIQSSEFTPPSQTLFSDLFDRFGRSSIDHWSDSTWEQFTLNALWRLCHQGVHAFRVHDDLSLSPIRHRDLLLDAVGQDIDLLIHEVLIPFCGSYLDQGFATWSIPDKDRGFLEAFISLFTEAHWGTDWWMKGVAKELRQIRERGTTPLQSISDSLRSLGVSVDDEEEFITQTLLALSGWAGMIWQIESTPSLVRQPIPKGTLAEFLAVRLILERSAITQVSRRELGHTTTLAELYRSLRARFRKRAAVDVIQREFQAFQLVQALGCSSEGLSQLAKEDWVNLIQEIEAFGSLERRRIYHAAYELKYTRQTLDAIAQHHPHTPPVNHRPIFQIVCCLDDREESLRRHIEEVAPECETFGTAAFFSVAMNYRGSGDAHFQPLCPVVIQPQHYVQEEVLLSVEPLHQKRQEIRRHLGAASLQWHTGSRKFLGGIVTGLLGTVAAVPLVAGVLFPRLNAKARKRFGRMIEPPPATRLQLHRGSPNPGSESDKLGYSYAEMAQIVTNVLKEIGILPQPSRLVLVLGHGSSSLNNPHESAYNCGACGGGRGGPNARAFAQMANDPHVRHHLALKGIEIPDDVWFVGGYHNTCNDSVTWHDLDLLPNTHKGDFAKAVQLIDVARKRNAQERCRRFESAPLTLTPENAIRHVEQRSEDLAEARPEYNHATNALCIMGRRERTRGLFLDRRAFLGSYDPTKDDENYSMLLQALGAAVPVCAGINLEYYFSTVDPAGFGCGSKLPLNVASLLGVMEGAASDLRPGLSQQMIEIHQPLRILFLIETTPEGMQAAFDRNETIRRLVVNEWIQLAILDPDSSTIRKYVDGRFEVYHPGTTPLPKVNQSVDWYRGWRGNLGFASIVATTSVGSRGEV